MNNTVEWILIGGPGHGDSVLVPEHDGSYMHVDYERMYENYDDRLTEYSRREVMSDGKTYYIGVLD